VQVQVRESKPWVAVGAIVVVAVAVGVVRFFTHRPPVLTAKDTMVLAEFANATGDPVFDGTLRQGLSIQLEQSPFLSIVSDQQIQQTLPLMGQKPDAKVTPEIARELCQRTASAAVLDGSISQIGTPYLLTVKAVNCSDGATLASTEAQASDKNHVLDALGKMASEMRNKLGESLSTVQKFDTPLEAATTPSLEALKAFSSGMRATSPPRLLNSTRISRLPMRGWASGIPLLENPPSQPDTPKRHTNCASVQVSLRGISYRLSTTKRFWVTSKKPNKAASFGFRLIRVPRCRIRTCQAQFIRRSVAMME